LRWGDLVDIAGGTAPAASPRGFTTSRRSDRELLTIARRGAASLSPWEKSFVQGCSGWVLSGRPLSARQRATLRGIAERVQLAKVMA
jgi:hypothetical protein